MITQLLSIRDLNACDMHRWFKQFASGEVSERSFKDVTLREHTNVYWVKADWCIVDTRFGLSSSSRTPERPFKIRSLHV